MTHGEQCAQSTHAAFSFWDEHPELARTWHHASNYLVILAVPDEPSLQSLLEKARDLGLVHTAVREPDYNDQLTAVVLGPCDEARRITSSLPLAMKEYVMA